MAKQTKLASVALVGDESLLGREVKEVLESRAPDVEVETFSASGEGNFSDVEGESVYLRPLNEASLEGKSAIILTGSPDGAGKAYEAVKQRGGTPAVIDCTGFLGDQPEAHLVAPLVQEVREREGWLFAIAHPAASALTLLLARLSKYRPLRSAVVNIFEPASERGKKGLTELHSQTSNLLAFKPLDQEIFGSQLAFNLLARYGEDAPLRLEQVEDRIARETRALSQRRTNGVPVPEPSLRLIQAPVFHGYSLSLWAEFESEISVGEIEEALACAQIEVRRSDDEPPHNAGSASQTGLLAGDVRVDRNNARAAWVWVAADNLRLIADAAVDLVRSLTVESP